MEQPIPLQIDLSDQQKFADTLFERMKLLCPAVEGLELYEFCYCLDNLTPKNGWMSVGLEPVNQIETKIQDRSWYERIKISPKEAGKPVMDEPVARLTQMLFVGIVTSQYSLEWVRDHFYFDLRGFFFLIRTLYFTEQVLHHLGGTPFVQFEEKQKAFEWVQAVGYQEFKKANLEVDSSFFAAIDRLIAVHGTPILVGIAGPTAAGKTEIAARLNEKFRSEGKKVTSFEMDNFLLDRDYREQHGIDSLGKAALHFELFLKCLRDLIAGQKITTPRYDFITGSSSHDLASQWKPGAATVEVEPADIIFIEGNFPFLLPEVADLVAIKVVYLTDDDVRLKRKWRRDMDFRKKYELNYFRNRYFREQFLMAESAFIPQLVMCDLAVDTTGARMWATPAVAKELSGKTDK